MTVGLILEISMPEYNRQWTSGARHWSRSFLVTTYIDYSSIKFIEISELFEITNKY